MTYEDNLKDTKLKTFYELYEFVVAGVTTRYTTAKQQDVLLNNNVYKRAKIERGEFVYDTKFQATTLEIRAPIDENTAKFVSNFPITDVNVTVLGFFADGETKVLFSGVVINATIQNFVAVMTVESSTELFRDPWPRLAHSAYCQHRLFSTGCGLNEDDYKTPITVDNLLSNGSIIEASQLASPVFPVSCTPQAAELDTWWKGGYVKLADESDLRLITDYDNVNQRITLQAPFDNRVIVGSNLIALPGDNRAPETCRDKFCNRAKYFGTPYIPRSNPAIFDFTE